MINEETKKMLNEYNTHNKKIAKNIYGLLVVDFVLMYMVWFSEDYFAEKIKGFVSVVLIVGILLFTLTSLFFFSKKQSAIMMANIVKGQIIKNTYVKTPSEFLIFSVDSFLTMLSIILIYMAGYQIEAFIYLILTLFISYNYYTNFHIVTTVLEKMLKIKNDGQDLNDISFKMENGNLLFLKNVKDN